MSPADQPQNVFFNRPEDAPFALGAGRVGALLIHGFPGTPADVRPLGERLAQAGFSAYGPLLPGLGREIARLGTMTRYDWLEAVRAARQDLHENHDQVVLIGFSMGGAIAMHLAAEDPPDALVLLAPFWRLGGWQFRLLPVLKRLMPTVAPFEKADFADPAVRRQLEAIAPGIDLDDPETQQALRRDVRLPLSVINEVRLLGESAARQTPRLDAPTLVLQGRQDATVKVGYTRRLVQRLPGEVVYHEFDGDHGFVRRLGESDVPETAAILRFLREQAGMQELSPAGGVAG